MATKKKLLTLAATAAATTTTSPYTNFLRKRISFVASASSFSSESPRLLSSSSSPPHRSFWNNHNLAFILSSSSSSSSYGSHRNMSTMASSEEGTTKVDVKSNLQSVLERMDSTMKKCNRDPNSVRLVAVSKTKPLDMILEAYEAGQRHFGENYAQELITKATTPNLPSDIQWHFIGPLQSNKAASLVKNVGLKQLSCIETVSTLKLATKLNRAVDTLLQENNNNDEKAGNDENQKLGIFIQVNTSGETTKSGVSATTTDDLISLIKNIRDECPHLKIRGLMTIGAPGDDSCLDRLVDCRSKVMEEELLGGEELELELSMGMSGDFEMAIEKGATSVRVGSTIFGARDYSNKKKG